MFKRNQITTAMLAVTLASVSGASLAQETATGNVGVTVSNAFSVTETTPLNFGTFLVNYRLADGTAADAPFGTPASIRMNGDGTYLPAQAAIVGSAGDANDAASFTQIAPGTPGVFAIADAAPNSPMRLDFSNDGTPIRMTKLGDNTVFFTLAVAATPTSGSDDVEVLDGPAAGQSYNSNNLITDASGAVSFAYGGTLSLPTTLVDTAGNTEFTDGTYAGTFTLSVNY